MPKQGIYSKMKIMIQNDIVKLCAKIKNENAPKNVNDKTNVKLKK